MVVETRNALAEHSPPRSRSIETGSITLPVWMEFEERAVCVPNDAFEGMKRGLTPEFTPRHFALALTWLIESWTGNRPFPSRSLILQGGGWMLSLPRIISVMASRMEKDSSVSSFDSILCSISDSRRIVRKTRRTKKKKKYRNEIIIVSWLNST